MRRGFKPRGFTIVETMIVLVVTAAILVSALTLVGGSQNKTEFSQATNDITQVINDTINNVATGYYANIGNFSNQKCQADPAGNITFSFSGTSEQGGSQDCTFLGRVLQFTNTDTYYIYNVVGLRQKAGTSIPVNDYDSAQPKLITSVVNGPGFPESTEVKHLKNGLKPKSLTDSSGRKISGLAFLSSLGDFDSSGGIKSGSQSINFVPIVPSVNSGLSTDQQTFITTFQTPATLNSGKLNPPESPELCLDSGGTNQSFVITIGGNGRQDSIVTAIKSGSCP